MLDLLWFTEGVDQRVGEVAPLIVEADVGEVDEGAHSEGHSETTPLPR